MLPFENLSPDPDNAYFAAGIHDTILNELAKLQNLNVIARTSVLRYADGQTPIPAIAEELNVETVMEGSVQYSEGRVLVTAQLIDPQTSAHLWSENYDREFAGIFEIQADIAMNIANALEAEFSLAEQAAIETAPTESSEAYSEYLKAIAAQAGASGGSNATWIAYLDRAIQLDPEFALAYAERAHNCAQVYIGVSRGCSGDPEELERRIMEDADRALELDPNLGLAHAARAMAHMGNWRGREAEEAFQRAYQLSPDADLLMEYGRFKRYRGEYEQAIALAQRAVDLDPHELYRLDQLAHAYRLAGRLDESAAAFREQRERNPARFGPTILLAQAEVARGNDAEALRLLSLAESLAGAGSIPAFRQSQMALIFAHADRPDDAQRFHDSVVEAARDGSVSSGVLARASLAVEDYDEVYRHLESALSERGGLVNLVEFQLNPWGDPELDTPRFRNLLSQLWDDR